MQNNNNTKLASKKISDATEMFELLKNNLGNFDIKRQLELASALRDNVVNDSHITNECKDDQKLADLRKQLLDQIQSFQMKLIDTVSAVKHTIKYEGNVKVTDFVAANNALFSIAVDEKNREINYSDELYTNIQEHKNHITTLNRIVEQGGSNEYKVLLMGEYQSGKTTLIDSIIGRHISAIGDGNTTSAVPIAFSYGSNINVNLLWKSKEQLFDLLASIKKYVKDFSLENFDIENKNERDVLYY